MNKKWTRRLGALTLFLACSAALCRGFCRQYIWTDPETSISENELDFKINEDSAPRGITNKHILPTWPTTINAKPWIQSVSAALAVADVNQDGFMDIYLTNSGNDSKNRLYINDGHGHFTEQSEKYGLADLNHDSFSMRPIFFDCKNDGGIELLLTTSRCPKLMEPDAHHHYTPREGALPETACGLTEAVTAVDVNGDGYLDLVLGIFTPKDTWYHSMPDNLVDAHNAGPLRVFLNDGHCNFKFSPESVPDKQAYFHHSMGVGDFRKSGHSDIWVAADSTTDRILINDNGKYQIGSPTYSNPRFSMNSDVVYLDGDDYPSIFVSQVFHMGYSPGGNTVWKFDGKKFKNRAEDLKLRECGWAWGSRSIDLNNDGLLDVATANGFISAQGDSDFWYAFGTLASSPNKMLSHPEFWPNLNGRNLSGHERDCLFLNRGDHFEDVGAITHFDDERADGRGVAVIDPDNSGHQHLVIANQGGPTRYYTVSSDNGNSWIGFDLESHHGVREALGARVMVDTGAHRYVREKYSTNTFSSQSDPRLHFGLGKAKDLKDVEIRWPDGRIEHFKDLSLNKYHHLVEAE